MKKKLMSIIIAAVIAAALAVPALACTPPLNPPSSPHIEFNWTPSEEFEAGIKYGVDQYLKEHPLDLSKIETETETETEETVEIDHVFDWRYYIPERLKASWRNMIRR